MAQTQERLSDQVIARQPLEARGGPGNTIERVTLPRRPQSRQACSSGSTSSPKTTAARIARTLGCKFEQEKDIWVSSDPDLITITPEPAGGCLITIELTTRPHQLTLTLSAIGIEPIRPYRPEGPSARDG